MTDGTHTGFVETKQYQRFKEFCDACRHCQYIGLCHGVPGVGKTLSSRHYANWDKVMAYNREKPGITLGEVIESSAVFYTVDVVNSPGQVRGEISHLRDKLRGFVLEDLYRERDERIAQVRQREAEERATLLSTDLHYRATATAAHKRDEALELIYQEYRPKYDTRPDPTRLVIVDEADRLKMTTLDQFRAIFDQGGIGLVLIGMPGLEKRLSRYPQLYSRVGFVHEFKWLSKEDVKQLLRDRWAPEGVSLPDEGWFDDEALATLIRMSEGQFRLLYRLLQQINRFLEINKLDKITSDVVAAARETLVIGTA
jgi:DNA transposition AAA+ family ATPase